MDEVLLVLLALVLTLACAVFVAAEFTALHTVTRVRSDTPLDDTLTVMRAAGTHLAAVTGDDGSSSAS